jgi:IclR family transcriptional regulator, KDG regulon repressor
VAPLPPAPGHDVPARAGRVGAPRRRPAASTVQSLSRGLGLLEVVAGTGSAGMGVTAAGAALGLKTSTAHHLLTSLVAHGYLEQHPQSGRYRLGPASLLLAQRFMSSVDLVELARPSLEMLHAEFDEWTFLSVLQEERSHAIFSLQSGRPLVLNSTVGAAGELHCTSSGKVLLSGMEAGRVEAYLTAAPLTRHTRSTIVGPDALRRELARVRGAGYATNREEDHEGLVGFAAPIKDAAGRVLAACGLGVPTFRTTPEREGAMIRAICRCAAEVSRRLGNPCSAADGLDAAPTAAETA